MDKPYRKELEEKIDELFVQLHQIDPSDRDWAVKAIRFNQELYFENTGDRYRIRDLQEALSQ